MLFRQEDLAVSYDPISEAANILNEGVYLTEDESFLSPKAIPVVENARIGAGVVQFDDIERLAEENGADYIDAMYAVAEANEIDPNQLAVAVDEWKIIDTPEVVDELANVVIKPMSPYDPVAMFVESCVDCFLESGDYRFLDDVCNPSLILNLNESRQKKKSLATGHGGQYYADNGSGTMTPLGGIYKGTTGGALVGNDKKKEELRKKHPEIAEKYKSHDNPKADSIGQEVENLFKQKQDLEAALKAGSHGAKGSDTYEAAQKRLDKITKDLTAKREAEARMRQGTAGTKRQARIDAAKEKERDALMAGQGSSSAMSYDDLAASAASVAPAASAAPAASNNQSQPEVKETQSFLSKVKHYTIDTPREYIAKAITWLKNKYQSFERVKNANSTPEDKRSILQKVLVAISSALNRLEGFLKKSKE